MKRSPIIFLQVVIVLIAIWAIALLLWEPHIEGRNIYATNFDIYFKDPFLAYAYIGSISFFVALYQAFRLLEYIGNDKAFSQEAVKCLRTIKYCALITIGFVAVGEIIILLNHGNDYPAGGIFIGILITLGSVIAATAASVLQRILQNGLDLKSEKSNNRRGNYK